MAGFVKAMRSEEADFLDKYPIANHVLNVIARRARRTPCKMSGLDVGECFVGHKGLGITEQQYRTAKKQLGSWGLVEFKRGRRATDVGTVAKLLNSKVYDINETEGNGSSTEEQRKDNGRVTTNKECKNGKNERKPSKARPSSSEEAQKYFEERGWNEAGIGERFFDYYESVGWKRGNSPVKDWKATVRTWIKKNEGKKPQQQKQVTAEDEQQRKANEWDGILNL